MRSLTIDSPSNSKTRHIGKSTRRPVGGSPRHGPSWVPWNRPSTTITSGAGEIRVGSKWKSGNASLFSSRKPATAASPSYVVPSASTSYFARPNFAAHAGKS